MPEKKAAFAKKTLGQNFLIDTATREKILEIAGNISGKNILEIGPGLGFLTTALLRSGADLTAVEIDERAVQILEKDLGHKKNFQLLKGDILTINLDEIFPQKMYSVIANIPYNITNPIIRKLLETTKNKPDFCLLMVQKEVAEKICNTKKRSILSIAVEVFAESYCAHTVDRNCFQPVPKVDSALLCLKIRPKPLVKKSQQKMFFTAVNAGFHEKRKKIGNTIGKFFGVAAKKLLADIDPNLRPENLSIQDWKGITQRAGRLDNQMTD